ncbi:hypothetical protein WR25_03936 [Diploscapter pachys]|uniref:RPGRIP1 C-terminal domain-containing protein n=1 Tax=Diploscapter pachys TaxID=2018661 RepID=A0A2A2J0M1_9BILA|nr:hypothetical protein WR25_03936 [Diploscapter pachys]
MISPSSTAVVAVISYDITLAKDLTDSIASYQRLESARNFLPLENWQTGQAFEELTIIVNKCSGLETLGKGPIGTCIAYELLSFSPFMTNYVTTDKTAVFDSTKDWAIPIAENMRKFIQDTEIVFFLAQNTAENRDTEPVLAMLSLPLAPLAQNRKIKGVFPMLDAEGNQTQLQLELSVFWKYGKPISKHFAHQFVEEKEKPTGISKDEPAKSDKSKLERVDKTESRETQERIEESKPISVEDHIKSLEPHGTSLPSLESSHSRETIEREDTTESFTAGKSDSQAVQPTIEEKIEKTIEEGPIIEEVEEVTEIVRETTEGKVDESEQAQDQRAEMIEEVDLPEANAMLSRQSSTSGESDATYTMEKHDEGTEEKSSNGSPAQDAEAEADKMKDLAKDEIRQMLRNLPPIAKPRLSKSPSEFQQSFPPSTLDFLERLDKKHQLKEQDEEGNGEEEGSDGMDNRERKIFFTDPLHQSIPPSEASSVASPTSRPEREKQPIQLPEKGGKSVIKLRSEADNASSKEGHENEEGSAVSVFIAKFAITDFSRLLTRNYDGVKVYIDWTFLDFPVEESRISETFELPRVPNVWIPIEFRKEYTLSRRRVALLEQWIELGNRLDFTLIAQTEDDRHEEELGVAQLELHRIPADYATTIPFLDVNGDQLAEVEVVLHYSASLFQ